MVCGYCGRSVATDPKQVRLFRELSLLKGKESKLEHDLKLMLTYYARGRLAAEGLNYGSGPIVYNLVDGYVNFYKERGYLGDIDIAWDHYAKHIAFLGSLKPKGR